jgi:hypothetical protein
LLYERAKARGISTFPNSFSRSIRLTVYSTHHDFYKSIPQTVSHLHTHTRSWRSWRRVGLPAYWHNRRERLS